MIQSKTRLIASEQSEAIRRERIGENAQKPLRFAIVLLSAFGEALCEGDIHPHARPHGRGQRDFLQILALGGGGLGFHQRAQQRDRSSRADSRPG